MPVDPSKLKARARQRLGTPPTDGNPEIALPAEDSGARPVPAAQPERGAQAAPTRPDPAPLRRALGGQIDGRMLRRTNRTVQFATRVTPAFDGAIRELAIERGCLLVEVLEDALAAYERLAGAARPGELPLAVLDRVMAQRRAAKA